MIWFCYNEVRSSTLNKDYFNVREVFTCDSKGIKENMG